MEIHIDEVIDYLTCPLLYKYRYIDKADELHTDKYKRANKQSIVIQYDKALHKAMAYIFHSAQDGFYPGLHNLSRRWGYLWVKPRSAQEDIRFKQASWRDDHEKKRKQGWEKLQEAWAHYDGNIGSPILVDYPYSIQVGNHILKGVIDLIQVRKNEKGREIIEMTEFITDYKYAPFLHIRRDWRVTAASLAFRKTMNVKEEKIVYHGIISGKLIQTERTESDFEQLEYLLDSIENMRQANIFYPVFNERCSTCPYEKQCEKGWYDVKN